MSAHHKSLLAITLTLALAGCAVVPSNAGDNPKDPLESINRQTHVLNMTLDEYVLHPVAQSYVDYVPEPIRDSVHNAYANLREPRNAINNLLQGKVSDSAVSVARFLINSTIGIVGLFDVAGHMNLERAPEDFGQTLGAWGVPAGPYIVWPLLGPSTVRDTVGYPFDVAAEPTTYLYWGESDLIPYSLAQGALYVVDTRAGLLATDAMLATAVDPYVAVREAYLQNREFEVWDGNPPIVFPADEFEDEDNEN